MVPKAIKTRTMIDALHDFRDSTGEGLFVGSVACLASSGGYCSNRLARDPIITLGTIVSIDFSPIY